MKPELQTLAEGEHTQDLVDARPHRGGILPAGQRPRHGGEPDAYDTSRPIRLTLYVYRADQVRSGTRWAASRKVRAHD